MSRPHRTHEWRGHADWLLEAFTSNDRATAIAFICDDARAEFWIRHVATEGRGPATSAQAKWLRSICLEAEMRLMTQHIV
jgi:hypothetical protein